MDFGIIAALMSFSPSVLLSNSQGHLSVFQGQMFCYDKQYNIDIAISEIKASEIPVDLATHNKASKQSSIKMAQ